MIALIIATGIVVSLVAYRIQRLFETPKSIQHVPALPALSILFSLLFGQSFDRLFNEKYKPVLDKLGFARLWLRGNWEIYVTDPQHAHEIMTNTDNFTKQPTSGETLSKKMLLSKFFGESNIVTSDGDEWRRHRRIANPAFKKQLPTKMFGECTEELIEKIHETQQESTVVHKLFQQLTLDALGRGLFSFDFEAIKSGETSHYIRVYNELMSGLFSPIYFFFPVLGD